MKQTKKLTTRFRPETRFELQPRPAVPFRATLETEFEELKKELLATRLADAKTELTPALRRAANEAAALAWVTRYPLLTFPALFDEKSRVAERQAKRQAQIRAQTLQFVLAA